MTREDLQKTEVTNYRGGGKHPSRNEDFRFPPSPNKEKKMGKNGFWRKQKSRGVSTKGAGVERGHLELEGGGVEKKQEGGGKRKCWKGYSSIKRHGNTPMG